MKSFISSETVVRYKLSLTFSTSFKAYFVFKTIPTSCMFLRFDKKFWSFTESETCVTGISHYLWHFSFSNVTIVFIFTYSRIERGEHRCIYYQIKDFCLLNVECLILNFCKSKREKTTDLLKVFRKIARLSKQSFNFRHWNILNT